MGDTHRSRIALVAFAVAVLGCANRTTSTNHPTSPPDEAPSASREANPAPEGTDAPGGEELERDTKLVEKTFLRGGPGWVKAAGAYGWVSVGRVFWVSVGSPGTSLLVATMGDGSAPVSLNGNVELVSAFLSKQFQGRFPGENAYGAIAQFVKDALLGKMPLVADRERLADLRRTGLAAWLKGREKDPAKFEQWFTGIVGHEGKTEWRLQFNVVDTRGGVDLVRVAGTVSPLSVRHFSVQAVKPAGEFFFAVEG